MVVRSVNASILTHMTIINKYNNYDILMNGVMFTSESAE